MKKQLRLPAKHELSFFNSIASSLLKQDEERDDLYARIDEAASAKANIPEELKALSWIGERNFASTAAADALNAATRTFAAKLPDINISPVYDTTEEYDLVERMETAIQWEFQRMNMVGKKSPHWRVVESAVKYCAVAIKVRHLPWDYDGVDKSARIKAILRSRTFAWQVFHPATVHSQESEGILERVLLAYNRSAQSIIDEFGEENSGVQEMLRQMNEDNATDLQETVFSFYDYTDWDDRCIWIIRNTPGMYVNRTPSGGTELVREGRQVGFLPWVIVDNKEPILKTLLESGLYDNLNAMRTMQFSKAVDQAAHPEYWISTPDGTLRGVSIDNQNPNQPLVTNTNANVQQLRPPMLDPQLAQLESMAESEAFRTTVAQILASVEKYASTQNFSVVNAMISAAMAQLALSQMAAERAEEQAIYKQFEWLDFTGEPLVGYSDGSGGKDKGTEMAIREKDFDLEYLYITVKLNPNAITDEQMKINNAINKVERLGLSREVALDELGHKNFKLNVSKRTSEDLYQAHIAGKSNEIAMAAQRLAEAKAQAEAQKQMQEEAQAAAQASPEATASQTASPAAEIMQGVDTRGGGMSAATPMMGREQING